MKERKNERRSGYMILLALALVCVMAIGGTTAGLLGGREAAYAEAAAVMVAEPMSDPSPAIYVTQKNANSVVGVLTNAQAWDRATGTIQEELISQGSGVVIKEGGYILTNCHVIESGTAYEILLANGEKVDAYLVGSDSSTDLAVLKVDDDVASQLVPVTLGSTENLVVGSTVIAIGNPGGEVLANTVTQGIVSALERTSVTAQNASRRISYIQHDAAINSGNSGGGLFNYKGELVGINTLKYAGSAYSSVTFEGLGFAIPIETVVDISGQLIEHGMVIRPGLGVTVSDFTDGPDEPLPNNPPKSVLVQTVTEGGAAEKAGMKQYDFIYAVNGERVSSMLDLTGILDQHEVGDTVSVTVIRYAQAGYYQTMGNSIFGYGFGYGSNSSTQFMAGGGYEEITLSVTLETLQAG